MRNKKGLTLVEVVVAMGLFGIIMVALFPAFLITNLMNITSREFTDANFIVQSELEKIYNQHQFFILGSHYEGSGYALLEAMACGCIPIVTNIPSYKFMTNNGDCALLFSPFSEFSSEG